MRMIGTADLHLTDRPEDEYRWAFIDWLVLRLKQYKADRLWILGDITDYKDNHSGALINRVVDAMQRLAAVCPVRIVQGNHDFTDPDAPTFGFLNELSGIAYYKTPWMLDDSGLTVAVLPYAKEPLAEWRAVLSGIDDADLVCMHQPLAGAVGGNGFALEAAAKPKWFSAAMTRALVLAGDIHNGQRLGNVHYIGSPYPIKYGDDHSPRVVYWDTNTNPDTLTDIPVPTIRKTVSEANGVDEALAFIAELREGDRLKVRLTLPREDFADWPATRRLVVRAAEEQGVVLYGCELFARSEKRRARLTDNKVTDTTTPAAVVTQYGAARGVPEGLVAIGMKFLP